ncbi:MAG: hypothetical protein OXG96_02160 [Acidobacteria bacterium]|nr:hypothetical protein [Acidobacteriota bacterium]
MGNQDYSLRFLVIFWFFLAGLISLFMAFTGTPPNGTSWYFSASPFSTLAYS